MWKHLKDCSLNKLISYILSICFIFLVSVRQELRYLNIRTFPFLLVEEEVVYFDSFSKRFKHSDWAMQVFNAVCGADLKKRETFFNNGLIVVNNCKFLSFFTYLWETVCMYICKHISILNFKYCYKKSIIFAHLVHPLFISIQLTSCMKLASRAIT